MRSCFATVNEKYKVLFFRKKYSKLYGETQAFTAASFFSQPRFAFVVVQKRINTRVYGASVDAATGAQSNFSNPAPGTVVDHHITRKHL